MESVSLRPPGLTRVGLIGVLLALAGGAWVLTGNRMAGMDAAPGTDLGELRWFAVSWLLMMAAMMLPSLVPAALVFAGAGGRTVAAFVVSYLAVWTTVGLLAYLAIESMRSLDLPFLAWDQTGRYLAAGLILTAAAYQISAAKGRCLDRCRSPLREERPGAGGGVRGGLRYGAACVGCCAGLMTALFALGVMSLTWMAAVAALIATEWLLPWRGPAVYGVAATLAVLAIWMAVAPGDLPGLTLPGSMAAM
jgi:predicted metal-binding membrane protein